MTTPDAAAQMISEQLLNRNVIVYIQDGRYFRGTFLCVDSGVNMILGNTDEMRTEESTVKTILKEPKVERNVGMVMIPGKYIVKVEVQESDDTAAAATTPPPPPQRDSSIGSSLGWEDDADLYT